MSSLTMVFGFFCAPICIYIYIYIYIYILYLISLLYIYIMYLIYLLFIYILYIYNGFAGIKDWFLIKCCKKCHFTDLYL